MLLWMGACIQFDSKVQKGQYVSQDQVIGKITDLENIQLTAFIPEAYIDGVRVDSEILFHFDGSAHKWKGKILRMSPVRTEVLPYPQLASTYQGELASKSRQR